MVDAEAMSRLRGVITKLARQLNATATGEGLTPTQASVLALISARGPLGLSELVELEGVNPTMLSRVVGKLTDLELIHRLPDPADLRAVRVEATPEGQQVHERIRSMRTQIVAECLDRLPARTATKVLDALPALEALADELRTVNAGHKPVPGRSA